jgi:hypothetical protein
VASTAQLKSVSMTFLLTGRETNGELLRIDMRVRAGGFASGEQVHAHQEGPSSTAVGRRCLNGEERRHAAASWCSPR